MLGLFTILVWAPRVSAAPATRLPATALLISAATTGAALVIVGSLRDVAWGHTAWSSPKKTGFGVASRSAARSWSLTPPSRGK
jgi:hypothetical protein